MTSAAGDEDEAPAPQDNDALSAEDESGRRDQDADMAPADLGADEQDEAAGPATIEQAATDREHDADAAMARSKPADQPDQPAETTEQAATSDQDADAATSDSDAGEREQGADAATSHRHADQRDQDADAATADSHADQRDHDGDAATSDRHAGEQDEDAATTRRDTGEAAAPDEGGGGAKGRRLESLHSVHFWAASPAGLLVGLLLLLLGFGLVVQLQSNTGSGLSSRRQDDLVRILDDLSSREERLRQQISDLNDARTRLTEGGNGSAAALDEAKRRAAELGILAGTLPAQGPGIQLTITDPKGSVTAEDMLDAVEELRGAGAEAISIGEVRIGLSSAFTQDTPTSPIMVDGRRLTAPYVFLVIGDPPTLATAMNIPGGVVDTVRSHDGATQIVQQDKVVIRALRQVRAPQYAQPSPTPTK